MPYEKVTKVTISLPGELVELADAIAAERATSRSAVIAGLLKQYRAERLRADMAEGYRALAGENLHDAEQALPLTSPVVLDDA